MSLAAHKLSHHCSEFSVSLCLFCVDLWREFFLCRKSTEEYYHRSGSWPDKGQGEPQGILQVTQFPNTLSEILLEKKTPKHVKDITLITERWAIISRRRVGLFEVSIWDTGGVVTFLLIKLSRVFHSWTPGLKIGRLQLEDYNTIKNRESTQNKW